ncbi:MAG: hypothetical protein LBN95_08440, partial [Prevotellaceae bacterium]|nr:hypothetical protein [Prevotellaceae bacterium]
MKTNIKINLVAFIAIIGCVFSCKNPNPPTPIVRDIYTASMFDGKVTVWKNGKILFQYEKNINSFYEGLIYVENNDVYTSDNKGTVFQNGQKKFDIEKNAELGTFYCNGMCVSNSDVYLVGYYMNEVQKTSAVVFKNGKPLYLFPCAYGLNTNAFSIYVIGNDVYFSGGRQTIITIPEPSESTMSIIWKNGEEIMTSSTNLSIFGNGNNIYYLVGKGNNEADVYKNGQYFFNHNYYEYVYWVLS